MLATALDAARADLERALYAQVQARQLVEASKQESEAANRAKDEFLAMLGHELRNPLAPIVTAFQLIKAQGEDRFAREHQVIERRIHHLIRLVDDLLDVSRITRGKVVLKKAPIEIETIVAKAVEMASPLFEQKLHRSSVAASSGRARVFGDEERLVQVLSNLLAHAARYTPPRGQIAIQATEENTEADRQVVISVSDNGIGIEREMLPRIFDLFVQGTRTLDRAEGGLGLGLALARNLVAMHGGAVSAHSDGLQRGSRFMVRLPALPESVEIGPLHPPERVPRVPPADVAVLDIGLPVLDGYELARRLRARPGCRELWLIAVTGYGQQSDRERSQQAGLNCHLVKPVDLSALCDAIDSAFLSSAPSIEATGSLQ